MSRAKVALASLIFDGTVYPRHSVDMSHVADIARAIEAGQEIPLPVVERKTKRIVDG